MANFVRNARFGLRLLGKNPGFTFVALLALVLGIGANTVMQDPDTLAGLLQPAGHTADAGEGLPARGRRAG